MCKQSRWCIIARDINQTHMCHGLRRHKPKHCGGSTFEFFIVMSTKTMASLNQNLDIHLYLGGKNYNATINLHFADWLPLQHFLE